MQKSGQWALLIGLAIAGVVLFTFQGRVTFSADSRKFLRDIGIDERRQLTTPYSSFEEFRTTVSKRADYYRPQYFNNPSAFGMFDKDIDDDSARLYSGFSVDERVNSCIDNYKKRYRREPPRNYDRWVRLAIRHNVEVEKLQFYDQIHLDLWPYRKADNGTGRITSQIVSLMRKHHAKWQVDKIEIEQGNVWQNDKRRVKVKNYFVDDVLQLGIEEAILPLVHFEMYLVWNDNPHSVHRHATPLPPVDDISSGKEASPASTSENGVADHGVAVVDHKTYTNTNVSGWSDSEEFIAHNECLRELYARRTSSTDGLPLSAWHPFFHNNPDIGHTSPYLLPFFADCKLPCFGDIVIPRAEYREDLKDGVEAVTPWEQRNETVFFRGSLSWPFTGKNSVIWVTQHLRYKVLTWAESMKQVVHQLFDVNIDVAVLKPYLTFCQQSTKAGSAPSEQVHVTKNLSSGAGSLQNSSRLSDNEDAVERACDKLEAETRRQQQQDTGNSSSSSFFVPPQSQYLNRYMLTLDGNSWTGRLSRDVASGSTVIYGTAYETWLTTRLQPFVHYIPLPLENSMASLTEIMNWLVQHPSIAKSIGVEGKRFATANLRRIDMVLYTLLAWIEYANLCDVTRW